MKQLWAEQYIKLAQKIAWTQQPPKGYDREDMISIAYLGLAQAEKYYDESKGKFSTFATKCIKHEFYKLYDYLSRNYRYKSTAYLENTIFHDESVRFQDLMPCYDEYPIETETILSTLKEKDRIIAELLWQGYTQTDIGAMMGIDKRKICNRVKRIRATVKGALAC